MKVLGIAIILFCTACNIPLSSEKSKLKVENLVNIYLEHTGPKTWFVAYRARNPVKKLVFERSLNRFRHGIFKPVTTGARIFEEEKHEYLEMTNGSSFTEVSFTFESYFESTPKDYEFFQPFSDGSVVIYTGHFNVHDTSADETINSFQFKSSKNENVIVDGRFFKTREEPYVPHSRGTYVYFGQIKPIEKKDFTAIFDPQLPPWIRDNLEKSFNSIFSFYIKKTGARPPFKPFLFLNYSDSENKDLDGFVGGTLPGLVQATISGGAWKQKSQDRFIRLARFYAHESAHIWNGQIFPYESSDMWMHEGGADGFAYRLLREEHIISESEYNDFLSTALNECLYRVKDSPLKKVFDDREYRMMYYCGSTLALMTEMALKNQKQGDLFTFWKKLFEKTGALPYSENLYFSVLEKDFSSPQLASFIRAFVNGPMLQTSEKLIAQMKSLGIPVTLSPKPPKALQPTYGRLVLRELQKRDCNGEYAISQMTTGFSMDGIPNCRNLKDKTLITHVGNFKLLDQGFEALIYVNETCAKNKTVELSNSFNKTNFTVDCPPRISYQTPYKIF